MFVYVAYKDAPELSEFRRRTSEPDESEEKTLLVNPVCPVRIILEYIRKKCRLGSFAHFDLCDERGALMGLFARNTYEYATEQFEHKRTYYVIVLKTEADKRLSVLPQVNRENKLYDELKSRVMWFLGRGGDVTPLVTPPPSKGTPPSAPAKATDRKK